MIPIKNRWSIIFDWSVGKQLIFFSIMKFQSSILDHSVLEWLNDRFFSFFKIFFRFFPDFFLIFFLQTNMPSGNMQHCESQKKNFTFVFLFIYCYCYRLYRLINFLRPIDRSINFSIFFNQSIEFFDSLKWTIID